MTDMTDEECDRLLDNLREVIENFGIASTFHEFMLIIALHMHELQACETDWLEARIKMKEVLKYYPVPELPKSLQPETSKGTPL